MADCFAALAMTNHIFSQGREAREKIGQRNARLLAGLEIAQRSFLLLQFIIADNDAMRGAQAIGEAQLRAQFFIEETALDLERIIQPQPQLFQHVKGFRSGGALRRDINYFSMKKPRFCGS